MQLHLKCPEGCALGFMHLPKDRVEILRNLRVRCKNEQCKHLVKYEQISSHYSQCPYSKCYCAYKPNCQEYVALCDFKDHIASCEHRS